jgi:hypothetical protein
MSVGIDVPFTRFSGTLDISLVPGAGSQPDCRHRFKKARQSSGRNRELDRCPKASAHVDQESCHRRLTMISRNLTIHERSAERREILRSGNNLAPLPGTTGVDAEIGHTGHAPSFEVNWTISSARVR